MLYQHTARFQIVLQEALRLQTLKPIVRADGKRPPSTYTDENMLAAIGFAKGRTTLTKFRLAKLEAFDAPELEHKLADDLPGGLRDHRLAQALWDHLTQAGFVRDALSAQNNNMSKKMLLGERQIANAISIFFDTHESQISRHAANGLVQKGPKGKYTERDWLCYKHSWSEKGRVVKSKFRFTYSEGEYFTVEDEQRSSGRFGKTTQELNETSNGIAISKSEKLWCFMKELDREQPRVFCFFKATPALLPTKKLGQAPEYTVIFGHLMETERRSESQFYSSYVVLVSDELDRLEFEKKYGKKENYNFESQIDIFPLEDGVNDSRPDLKFIIPSFVRDYLETGIQKL